MESMRTTWSFRWQLTLTMLVFLAGAIGLFFLLNYQFEKQILTDQVRQRALLTGKTVQINLEQFLSGSNPADLSSLSESQKRKIRRFILHFSEEEDQLNIFTQRKEGHDLFFINSENRVLVDYPARREGRILPQEERIGPETIDLLKRNHIDVRIENRGPHTLMLMTFPLFLDQRILGFGRIEVSMDSVVRVMKETRIRGLATAAGLLLIGFIVATYFSKNITRPIGEIVQTASRMERGDFSHRLEESRKDEIGVLINAFNKMADGILKLEETQKRVKKLEVASQLGARVAHEIKNPLNSVGLLIDHLKDRLARSHPPGVEKDLDLLKTMKQEVYRLNAIVEGFLRSARPMPLTLQPTNLNALVETTLESILPEIDQRCIKIFRHFEIRLPEVPLDYRQMRQALLNLMINATQAMPDGGELHLSTSFSEPAGGEAVVSVRDTGHGIFPEILPRLFEDYFTTKEGGFGLGLSIVERIVREHGGRIDVESLKGTGSLFTITIPLGTERDNA